MAVTRQSQPWQLRQTQAEADGRRGAGRSCSCLGVGQGLGKDLSKITTCESLEISLGADALGWSCRMFLRSSPRHLTSVWKTLPKGKGRTSLLNVCEESEPMGGGRMYGSGSGLGGCSQFPFCLRTQ